MNRAMSDRSTVLTQMTKQQDKKTVLPPDFNIAKQLLAALKAVTVPPVVIGGGLLRDLFTQDSSLAMAIGGHRGMGENLITDQETFMAENLWRENTITSFLKARQHGASFVEMDVQVTRDGVPVIWHDDEIAFGARSNPFRCQICDLRFDEFRSLGPQLSTSPDESRRFRELITLHRKFRNSMQNTNSTIDVYDPWHCFDDDALPSLDQVLTGLPESLSINLEVKMTTPWSLVQTPPHEVLRCTQPVIDLLSESYTRGSSRRVLLSSFDPDVCVEMRRQLKEAGVRQVPVMYITTGGGEVHGDPRRVSISAAIEFCLENDLDGFVVDSSVLRQQKDLMVTVGKLGRLQVVTYGLENNDVDWLVEQWRIGVQAAIVDDVAKVVPLYVQEVKNSLARTGD